MSAGAFIGATARWLAFGVGGTSTLATEAAAATACAGVRAGGVCTGGVEDGLVGEVTGAADGGFIKPLRRAAPVRGSSFATTAFSLALAASLFALEGPGMGGPLYSGLLSVLTGPVAAVMLVTGLRPEMVVYRSESGADSVDGFIAFGFRTNGLDGVPNRFVSEKAALGFEARGRA